MLGDVRERESVNRSEGGEYEKERDIVGVCTGEMHAPSPIDTYTGVVGVVSFIVLLCYLFS